MKKLLFIEASPRGEQSYSAMIAHQLVERFTELYPDYIIDKVELWKENLPEFNGDAIAAKYAVLGKKEHTPEQAQAWAEIARICERFKSADYIVIATPMWNRSIPYRLKHYVDLLTQPTLTFSFSLQEGYKGLVSDRPVLIITAGANVFTGDSPLKEKDFLFPYLKDWLDFIGIGDVERIEIAPTVGPQQGMVHAKSKALQQAREWAEARSKLCEI